LFWPSPTIFSGDFHSICNCTLPKLRLVCISPIPRPNLTVILPSPFKVHFTSLESLALTHSSKLEPSNNTIASLVALPFLPGVTFGGFGPQTSVASGFVGSIYLLASLFSWDQALTAIKAINRGETNFFIY